jgi:hypothetical protein
VFKLTRFCSSLWGANLYRVQDPKARKQIGSRPLVIHHFSNSDATRPLSQLRIKDRRAILYCHNNTSLCTETDLFREIGDSKRESLVELTPFIASDTGVPVQRGLLQIYTYVPRADIMARYPALGFYLWLPALNASFILPLSGFCSNQRILADFLDDFRMTYWTRKSCLNLIFDLRSFTYGRLNIKVLYRT